ncbi:MAG: toast rack family protein [Actinomycetota bacterium]|nr:toast rack family protein [Actinomycetota bacterium]
MRCERCGHQNKPGDVFCRDCGIRIGPGGPGPAGREGVAGETTIEREEAPSSPPPSYPAHAPQPVYRPGPRHTSGWAVTSMVLGALSFLFLPFVGAVLAVVFGILAKRGAKHSEDEPADSGMSTAGIVLGVINLSFCTVAAALFIPWIIANLGEVHEISRTVRLQGAREVAVELELREGTLAVRGGAEALFEGDFSYNVDQWEPEIDYTIENKRGELHLKQGGGWGLSTLWNSRNDWDIAFNNRVPLELKAVLSSGSASLKLGTLNLSDLEVENSSGDVAVDLSGDMPHLGGVDIGLSSGDLALTMEGRYTSYTRLDIDGSSGDVWVSLLGEWEDTLGAGITSSSGDVTLELPSGVGVRVSARNGSGEVEAPGMKVEGEKGERVVYTNDAWGESVITLQFEIQVSSGDIYLLLKE